MAKNNTNLDTQKGYVPTEDDSSLKGTLLFTMTVGLVIVGSWSAVFYLFLNRM